MQKTCEIEFIAKMFDKDKGELVTYRLNYCIVLTTSFQYVRYLILGYIICQKPVIDWEKRNSILLIYKLIYQVKINYIKICAPLQRIITRFLS